MRRQPRNGGFIAGKSSRTTFRAQGIFEQTMFDCRRKIHNCNILCGKPNAINLPFRFIQPIKIVKHGDFGDGLHWVYHITPKASRGWNGSSRPSFSALSPERWHSFKVTSCDIRSRLVAEYSKLHSGDDSSTDVHW